MGRHKDIDISYQDGGFVVYTDHKAHIGQAYLTEHFKRSVCFWLRLAEFNTSFKHKVGSEMVPADSLSRHIASVALTDTHCTKI
jgi:hypothetical protein